VTYDASICMGCRYCMVACPFGLTRYEWESPTPRVRKCILCHDKIVSGELEQPACTAACPVGATLFGDREALLREAKDRIRRHPGRYLPHVWGEREVGGTSVLYLSDVPLDTAGWPADLDERARPPEARRVLHTVPYTFAGVVAVMGAVHWSLRRREEVAAAEGHDSGDGGAS
jgi:formate dehydrogenase iron-sulfur subunit